MRKWFSSLSPKKKLALVTGGTAVVSFSGGFATARLTDRSEVKELRGKLRRGEKVEAAPTVDVENEAEDEEEDKEDLKDEDITAELEEILALHKQIDELKKELETTKNSKPDTEEIKKFLAEFSNKTKEDKGITAKLFEYVKLLGSADNAEVMLDLMNSSSSDIVKMLEGYVKK